MRMPRLVQLFRRRAVAGLVLVFGLLITAAGAWHAERAAARLSRQRFENAVQSASDAIRARVRMHSLLLVGVSGLFAAGPSVSPEEFARYVARLELRRRTPGLQGLGFAERVRASDLTAWLERAHSELGADFQVWPGERRDDYFPIVFLEPRDLRNRRAMGYDMFTEPVRHAAMEAAWRSGHMAASGRVTLVQEIDERKQAGFLLYLPVYAGGPPPATEEARWQALRGFVYSPFRADDLFKGIFGTQSYPEVHFRVYDGTNLSPDGLMYSSVPDEAPSARARWRTLEPLELPGHFWTVQYESREEQGSSVLRRPELWIATIGGVVALLLAWGLWTLVAERELLVRAQAEIRELNEGLERKVAERTSALQEANRQLEGFSYSISHDLRAPLRHVNGFIGLLREHLGPQADAQTAGYMRTIEDAAVRLGTLIDDLLTFSRLSRTDVKMTRVSARELVDGAIMALAADQGERVIEWTIDPLPEVEADRQMLLQVWLSLLSNAVKFTRGRPVARIHVGAVEKPGEVEFFVADNGVGFEMAYAGKLFGVFQRLHHLDEFEGTGIGLAHVKQIVEKHGGQVSAQAEEGRGATFRFTLPRRGTHG